MFRKMVEKIKEYNKIRLLINVTVLLIILHYTNTGDFWRDSVIGGFYYFIALGIIGIGYKFVNINNIKR